MINWSKRKRGLIIFILTVMLFLLVWWLLYTLFGHQLIKVVYEGNSIKTLNRLIKHQEVYPLEHYYIVADKLFIGYSIFLVIFAVFFITFSLLSTWNLPDLFIAAITPTALLFSGGLILKRILMAPLYLWNGIRLAWTFSIMHGYRLYYPADSGPVLSLLAGPLQPLVYLPATLANSPTFALIFASSISACFYFLPILWLHIGKDLLAPKKLLLALCGFACFCLFTLSSQPLSDSAFIIYADAPALGFAALACAVLYHRRCEDSIPSLMLAALFSVSAVWTKQTLIPLLFALPIYVLLADGYRCFKRYMLCLCVSGFAVSALFLSVFNARNLWFNMVTVPSLTPWVSGTSRITALSTATHHLIKKCILFAAILVFYSLHQLFSSNVPNKLKAWLSSNRWTMLAIVGLFMVPTSVLGRARIGGAIHTLSPAVYFLVAAFTLALMTFISSLPSYARFAQNAWKLLFVSLIIGLICIHALTLCDIDRKLLDEISGNDQKVAYEYTKNHPGEAYFPNNPLSSLLAEGKLYHHPYGLYDREMSGFRVSDEHFQAHIPADIRLVAFPKRSAQLYQYIMKYLPDFSKQVTIDELPGCKVFIRE